MGVRVRVAMAMAMAIWWVMAWLSLTCTDGQDGNIECTPAQVEHQNQLLVFLLNN